MAVADLPRDLPEEEAAADLEVGLADRTLGLDAGGDRCSLAGGSLFECALLGDALLWDQSTPNPTFCVCGTSLLA